jgi:hypothetical protein
MKQLITLKSLGIAFTVAAILLVGCSGDDPKENSGFVNQVVDDSVNKLVDGIVEASYVSAPVDVEVKSSVSDIADIVVLDSILYAVFDGGLVIYDFRNRETSFIRNGEEFNSIVKHGDQVFVGGEKLYTLVNNNLEPAGFEIEGTVGSLYSFDYHLLVGTDRGLYSNSVFGNERLMDDVSVTAMVSDGAGMWVAIDGQGLYRWDGDMFRKRYLLRDTSIFDNVYALDFNHDHLYVGAATGFFIFNGGRWEHRTIDNGLPSDDVRTIDASSWVVYLGTGEGVVSYFEKNIIPVKKLETTIASVIEPMGKKLIVGTPSDGIVMKAGPFVKTLVEPESERKEEIFSQSEDETI